MQHRTNVSPVPLTVDRSESAVSLTYLDGRVVTYSGPFEDRDGEVTANRTFEVHVLVVDPETGQGIMTYVNDYDTSDDILESTGVGRVLVEKDSQEVIYPGLSVGLSGETIQVTAGNIDDAWVYVFVENDRGEAGFRLATPTTH